MHTVKSAAGPQAAAACCCRARSPAERQARTPAAPGALQRERRRREQLLLPVRAQAGSDLDICVRVCCQPRKRPVSSACRCAGGRGAPAAGGARVRASRRRPADCGWTDTADPGAASSARRCCRTALLLHAHGCAQLHDARRKRQRRRLLGCCAGSCCWRASSSSSNRLRCGCPYSRRQLLGRSFVLPPAWLPQQQIAQALVQLVLLACGTALAAGGVAAADAASGTCRLERQLMLQRLPGLGLLARTQLLRCRGGSAPALCHSGSLALALLLQLLLPGRWRRPVSAAAAACRLLPDCAGRRRLLLLLGGGAAAAAAACRASLRGCIAAAAAAATRQGLGGPAGAAISSRLLRSLQLAQQRPEQPLLLLALLQPAVQRLCADTGQAGSASAWLHASTGGCRLTAASARSCRSGASASSSCSSMSFGWCWAGLGVHTAGS